MICPDGFTTRQPTPISGFFFAFAFFIDVYREPVRRRLGHAGPANVVGELLRLAERLVAEADQRDAALQAYPDYLMVALGVHPPVLLVLAVALAAREGVHAPLGVGEVLVLRAVQAEQVQGDDGGRVRVPLQRVHAVTLAELGGHVVDVELVGGDGLEQVRVAVDQRPVCDLVEGLPVVRVPAADDYDSLRFHISANLSGVHPTRSDTCPSPISTILHWPSVRCAMSTEKNGDGMSRATRASMLMALVSNASSWP